MNIEKVSDNSNNIPIILSETLPQYKYLIILDFEANCLERKKIYPQEIVEFPCIVYDIEKRLIDRTKDFRQFVKITIPVTEFCTQLTHVTQENVDSGNQLKYVLKMHNEWMMNNDLIGNSLFVTCGNWDLNTALPNNLHYLGIKGRKYFDEWCNVKEIFNKYHLEQFGKPAHIGMNGMLKVFGLQPVGWVHSGIDDCASIALIVDALIKKGYEFHVTKSTK
jgi:ERI1 exoribonuclease 3